MEPLLVARDLSKRFGGVRALHRVSFAINTGEIYGLIGPNGAGKTTLFNVLTGFYQRDAGSVMFAGAPLPTRDPARIARAGLSRTFQNIRLFAQMTALENVMVGRHSKSHCGPLGAILRTVAAREEERAMTRRAMELLHYVGIDVHANTQAHHLSYGDQRRLEIARALAAEPKLLALDEPAAGMNATETAALGTLLRGLRDDGLTLLVIEHDVHWIMGLCDRIAVLDYGEKIAEGPPQVVRQDSRVIEAYLGGAP